jgi:hypothetical protein
VGLITDKGLLTPPAMRQGADEIGHRSTGHEQGRLHPHPFGGQFLETVDRRVSPNTSSPSSARPWPSHGFGGQRYRIASQINHFMADSGISEFDRQ